jgi:hypothetical protein
MSRGRGVVGSATQCVWGGAGAGVQGMKQHHSSRSCGSCGSIGCSCRVILMAFVVRHIGCLAGGKQVPV